MLLTPCLPSNMEIYIYPNISNKEKLLPSLDLIWAIETVQILIVLDFVTLWKLAKFDEELDIVWTMQKQLHMSKVRAKGAEGNLRYAKKLKGKFKCYKVPPK